MASAFSSRTRKIMSMVTLPEEEEPSDEEFDSDDSYNVEDEIENSEHDSDSETDEQEVEDEVDERVVRNSVEEVVAGPSCDGSSMASTIEPENYYGQKIASLGVQPNQRL